MEILKLAQVQTQQNWNLNRVVKQLELNLCCALPLSPGSFGYILSRDVCRVTDTTKLPSLPRHYQLMGHVILAPGEGQQREECAPRGRKRHRELWKAITLLPVLDNPCSWTPTPRCGLRCTTGRTGVHWSGSSPQATTACRKHGLVWDVSRGHSSSPTSSPGRTLHLRGTHMSGNL